MPEEAIVHPGLGAAALLATEEFIIDRFDAFENRGGEGEVPFIEDAPKRKGASGISEGASWCTVFMFTCARLVPP